MPRYKVTYMLANLRDLGETHEEVVLANNREQAKNIIRRRYDGKVKILWCDYGFSDDSSRKYSSYNTETSSETSSSDEERGFDWFVFCFQAICCAVALSPFIWFLFSQQ